MNAYFDESAQVQISKGLRYSNGRVYRTCHPSVVNRAFRKLTRQFSTNSRAVPNALTYWGDSQNLIPGVELYYESSSPYRRQGQNWSWAFSIGEWYWMILMTGHSDPAEWKTYYWS